MSFDLIAFLAQGPLSSADADAHLNCLAERDRARCRELNRDARLPRIRPRPPLDAFYEDVVRRYPDLDNLPDEDLDRSPWSVGLLGPWDDHIDLNISSPARPEVAKFVTSLALSHGVFVLDPQFGVVYTPQQYCSDSRTSVSSPWLHATTPGNQPLFVDLVHALEGRPDPFLIAECSSDEYMQALWQDDGWLIEVREGDAEHHYQAQGLDPDRAISALVSYDWGRGDWRSGLDLTLVRFG